MKDLTLPLLLAFIVFYNQSDVKLKPEGSGNAILPSALDLQPGSYYLPKTPAQSSPKVPRFSHTVMPQAFMAAIFP